MEEVEDMFVKVVKCVIEIMCEELEYININLLFVFLEEMMIKFEMLLRNF